MNTESGLARPQSSQKLRRRNFEKIQFKFFDIVLLTIF
jgi:hypothetical protein